MSATSEFSNGAVAPTPALFTIVANIAWSGVGVSAYPEFPLTKGLTSRAIAEKKTVNVGDVTSDPDYLTALSTTRSEVIVPILDGNSGHVLGTIDVESERPHAFDPTAQSELEGCALLLRRFWNGDAQD